MPSPNDPTLASVLQSTLEETAYVLCDPQAPGATDAGPYVCASLRLSDGRDHELRLYVPRAVAGELSASMLGENSVTDEEAEATVGELLNIMAGCWLAQRPEHDKARAIGVPRIDTAAARGDAPNLQATVWVNGQAAVSLEALSREE